MDPLAITTGILSFIDTALKLKAFVDKPGENRRRLAELLEDILLTLRELEELCRVHKELLHDSRDFEYSMLRLQNQFTRVRKKCERIMEPHHRKGVAKFKAKISALIMADDVEAEIRNLKETSRDCLQRFIATTSARIQLSVVSMEQAILVSTSEQRVLSERFSSAYGRLVVATHASGNSPATELDRVPTKVDLDYLCLHLRSITQTLDRLSMRGSIIPEEPQGKFLALEPINFAEDYHATPLRRTLAKSINTVQDIDDGPSTIFIQTLAMSLMTISHGLKDLPLPEEAIRLTNWGIILYRTLAKAQGGDKYLPFLHTGLISLMPLYGYDSKDALIASEAAMDLTRSLLSYGDLYKQEVLVSHIAHPIVLRQHGRLSDAIVCLEEGLHILRSFPQQSKGTAVSWTGRGADDVISRDIVTAQVELLLLGELSTTHYITGNEEESNARRLDAFLIYVALRQLKNTSPAHASMQIPCDDSYFQDLLETTAELEETPTPKD